MKKNLIMREGFTYYLLSTIVITILFISYLFTQQHSFMDIGGWIFYICACISHAALFTIIPFIILFLPAHYIIGTNRKWDIGLLCFGMILLDSFALIDGIVYHLYRFHINGIVMNMVFGEGSSQIFTFNIMLYLEVIAFLILIIIGNLLLVWLSRRWAQNQNQRSIYMPSLIIWAAITLFSNLFHVYAAAAPKKSVIESATFIPYYFPLTANSILVKWGIVSRESLNEMNFEQNNDATACYPQHPIVVSPNNKKPLNIIILAIDSWNRRTLTPECMPNTYAFSKLCENYTNHLSSSNGTRGSIFGMFYGVSSYYWKDFDLASIHPILIHELLKQGYYVQAYPSATLLSPPFAKNVFKEVPHLNIAAKGKNVYENDCDITNTFLRDLSKYDGKRPFFSFIFYNLAHAIDLPKEKITHFKPTWNYADYTKLSNNMDATPFFNLYRNCTYQVDSLAGKIYQALKEKKMLNNTIVIITGDHGQEFNENHKNYWGHGSNYTKAQISVPFIYYYPGCKPKTITHRTTHYDVSATLLKKVLKVKNPISDFSMGYTLDNPSPRNWHIVGDDLDYAFIVEHDRIIEKKPAGFMDVFDAHLNPLNNAMPNAKELHQALMKLNSFYKH